MGLASLGFDPGPADGLFGAACKTLLDSVPRKNYKDSIYGVAWLMVRFWRR